LTEELAEGGGDEESSEFLALASPGVPDDDDDFPNLKKIGFLNWQTLNIILSDTSRNSLID
jgi:hypothetical protein